MMKTMDRRLKAFTLIELVVVIAIIGVLACIIVPSATKHIKEAQKRADVENARIIYEAVNAIVLTDDTAAEGFYPSKGMTYSLDVTVNEGYSKAEGYETYKLYPVARAYGNDQITHKNNDWGWSSTETSGNNKKQRQVFIDKLNAFEGFANKKGKVYVKMSCRTHDDGKNITKAGKGSSAGGSSFRDGIDNFITDKWLICVRRDTDAIEIWAGNSNGKGASGPMYRLWPNPDREYCINGGADTSNSGSIN